MVGIYRIVFGVCFLIAATARGYGQAEQGVLDARDWNVASDRLVLRGYWRWYDQKLLKPETLSKHRGVAEYFPALWNKTRADGNGRGVATYALSVLLPDSVTLLALEVPQLYSSCNVWADGRLVATVGKVGATHDASVPQWVHKVVTIEVSPRDTLKLVVQIANFHHYKGGLRDPLVLGDAQRMRDRQAAVMMMSAGESIVIFCLALGMFILYFMQQKQPVVLYFALLCLTWSVRSLFSGIYPISLFMPGFNWHALVRIEYLTLYGGGIWSVLFLHHLFKNFGSAILTYTLVGLNVLFALFTLFTPVTVFSQWVSLYLAVAGMIVLYSGVIVIRAMLVEQAGAWFFVASIVLGMLMFGYDIVAYQADASNVVVLALGYVVLFLLTTVALLLHLGILRGNASTGNMLRYDDLFKK